MTRDNVMGGSKTDAHFEKKKNNLKKSVNTKKKQNVKVKEKKRLVNL